MSRTPASARAPAPYAPTPRPPAGRGLVRRRVLGLVGLAGATAAAGAVVFWQGRQHQAADAARAASERLFTWSEAGDIQSLDLTTGEGRVVVQHHPGEAVPWRITEPRATAGESMAIESLLRTLLAAKTQAEVPRGDGDAASAPDLALFGLDAPRMVLALTGPDGASERLEVGHKNAFDDTLFVRARGRPEVYIGPATLEQALDKSFFDLRDKRVVALPSSTLAEVVVEAEGTAGYTLARHGEAWRLAAPIEAPADRTQAEALVGALTGLRATRFVAEVGNDPQEVRAHGLERPLYRATVSDDTQARAVLRVGRRSGGPSDAFFAQVEPSGPIVELGSDWVVKKLSIGLWELRDRHVAAIAARDVARLTVRAGDRALVAVREDGDGGGQASWQGEAQGGGEPRREALDAGKVAALIDRLRDLEASGVAAEAADAALAGRLGLARPALEVRLEGAPPIPGDEAAARPALANLRLTAPAAGERLVDNTLGGPIWRVAAADVEGIGPAIEALLADPPAPPDATAQAGEGD